MIHLIARYPALADTRILSFAAALALALVSIVASGDPVAAGWSAIGGRGGCGGCGGCIACPCREEHDPGFCTHEVCERSFPMRHLIAHYPVFADARVLSFVAAVALAVVSLVVSGDPAAATANIGGGR